MKKLYLRHGGHCIVDEKDYDFLNQWSWTESKGKRTSYVIRSFYSKVTKKSKTIMMHRIILGLTTKDFVADHINKNGLDNRRENLRAISYSNNSVTKNVYRNKSSNYRGVFLVNGKFISQIRLNGKQIYLGSFISELTAAEAYNKAAIKYHGEFANLNKFD